VRVNASNGRAPLPLELVVVWLLFVVDAVAMLVTYSRVPAHELYHVSHNGLAGGASRVLVFSNFSTALAAIAILALLADRLPGMLWQGAAAAGVVLCAAVFWPGVVDQADLDAKPANAVAAAGVLVALALTAVAGRPRWAGRQSGDRLRVVVAVLALFVGLPWVAAEAGLFLGGGPLLGHVFQTGKHPPSVPGLPPFPPTVHHGHHHGMDGVLLMLTALLLSRVVPSVRRRWLRVSVGLYVALMACYAVGNIGNDFWIEQVNKRGWTSWQFPDVLRPKLTIAWGVILLGMAALYAVSVWWSERASSRDGMRPA